MTTSSQIDKKILKFVLNYYKKVFKYYNKCVIIIRTGKNRSDYFCKGEVLNRIIKTISLIISGVILLSLCGCEITMSADELMHPPRLTEEQEDIYNALLGATENYAVKLKYPRSGDYKSAFVMYDIDSDGMSEALVFYDNATAGSSSTEASVNIAVFDEVDGKWMLTDKFQYSCSDIDRIDFLHNSDGSIDIAIGFITGLSERVLDVYNYNAERKMTQIYQENYTKLFVCDADSDGIDELLVFDNNYVSMTSVMEIVQPDLNFEITASVKMHEDISEISNILTNKTPDGKLLIYVDALNVSNMLITEVISFDGSSAVNLTYDLSKGYNVQTQRPTGILSEDIDSDGEIEVPSASVFPGYENEEKEKQESAIQWLTLENDTFTRKHYSYYSLNDGYIFIFPERWVGLVTVKYDDEKNETVFLKNEGPEIDAMPELMRIKAALVGTKLTDNFKDYQFITSNYEYDYYIKLSDDSTENLVLTSTEATYGLHAIIK